MKYIFTRNGKTYHFDWKESGVPSKKQLGQIADKLDAEEFQERESSKDPSKVASSSAYGKIGEVASEGIESISQSPIGKGISWALDSPDSVKEFNKKGHELIDESPLGEERDIQKGIANKSLDLLTPSRLDIATVGLGLAAKPGLKVAGKVIDEIGEFGKAAKTVLKAEELGKEAGVVKLGRSSGTNPRILGTNPRSIKQAEEKLDEIVDLVTAGEDAEGIAVKLNLKPGTVQSVLKKHNLVKKGDEDIVEAVNKVVEGKSDTGPLTEEVSNEFTNTGPLAKGRRFDRGGKGGKPPSGNEPPDIPDEPKLPKNFGREPFKWSHLKDLAGPFQRSLQSLGEFSFPLRQGAVALTSHPSHIPEVIKNMGKAAIDPSFSDEVLREIGKRPFANIEEFALRGDELKPVTRNLYQEAKLGLSDPTDIFPSQLAHTIPGIAQLSKRSEAAYGAGADTLRANLFDQVLEKHGFSPSNLPSNEQIEQFGNYVNTVTGYGRGNDLFERAAPFLGNYIFYSPRYQKSRLDMINPGNYLGMNERFGNMNPFGPASGAKEMAKDVGTFAGVTGGGLAGLDYLSDGDIDTNFNPVDSDFLKTRIDDSNTRLDFSAGFAPQLRTAARLGQDLAQRQFGTDEYAELTEPVLGDLADKNFDSGFEAGKFVRSKLAPGISTLVDLTVGEGKNVVGEPLANTKYFGKEFDTPYLGYGLSQHTPLYYQGLGEIEDTPSLAVAAPTGFFGSGASTYDPVERKKGKPKKNNPYSEIDALYKKLYGK